MKSIEALLQEVDSNISELEAQLSYWKSVRQALIQSEVSAIVGNRELKSAHTPAVTKAVNRTVQLPELAAADYDVSWHFNQKLVYFARQNKRAFRNKDVVAFVNKMEGKEKAALTLTKNPPSKFQLAVEQNVLVGFKVANSNLHTFYVLPEWLSADGKEVKQQFRPPEEEYGNMPPERRHPQHYVWLRASK